MKFHLITSAAVAMSLLAVGAAGAKARGPKVRDICQADIQRMCPTVTPGKGQMRRCFKGRMNQVSPDCLTAIQTAKARRAERKAAMAANRQSAPPQAMPPAH